MRAHIVFGNAVHNIYHVNISEPKLTEEMKRHAVTVSLTEEHSDLKIAAFLKLARSFVFKISSKLKAARFDVTNIAHRKQYCQRYYIIKMSGFVSMSMRALARELHIDEATIRSVIHVDLH